MNTVINKTASSVINAKDESDKDVNNLPLIQINAKTGTFTCVECENDVKPQVNGVEGQVDADLKIITEELTNNPGKVQYSYCPICGMEYQFVLNNEILALLPSDEEK